MGAKVSQKAVGSKPNPPSAPPPKAQCRCPCTCGHSHGRASGGTCAWCVTSKERYEHLTNKYELVQCPCTCGHSGVCTSCALRDLRESGPIDTSKRNTDTPKKRLASLIIEQAEDDGLWGLPLDPRDQNIVEAYLQQGLRRLHAAVEEFLSSV